MNRLFGKRNKIIFLALVLILLGLAWVELAVGIFGTHWASN